MVHPRPCPLEAKERRGGSRERAGVRRWWPQRLLSSQLSDLEAQQPLPKLPRTLMARFKLLLFVCPMFFLFLLGRYFEIARHKTHQNPEIRAITATLPELLGIRHTHNELFLSKKSTSGSVDHKKTGSEGDSSAPYAQMKQKRIHTDRCSRPGDPWVAVRLPLGVRTGSRHRSPPIPLSRSSK